jgi:hypothetical protein
MTNILGKKICAKRIKGLNYLNYDELSSMKSKICNAGPNQVKVQEN